MAEADPSSLKRAPHGEPSVAPAQSAIDESPASFTALLSSARGMLVALALLETLFATLTGAATALMMALVVLDLVPFSLGLRSALLALVAVGASGGLFVGAHKMLALRHDLVVGARLEEALVRRGVDARDAVRAAVELLSSRDDAALGRSRSLADAHVVLTAARVRSAGALSSLPGVALERAVPVLGVGTVVAFIILAWGLGASTSFSTHWHRLFVDAGIERALEQRASSMLPLVTDLKLTLRFPAYMQEPDEVMPGSSGDVNAPRGTEVIIEGRADRALLRASLLTGQQEIAAVVRDGRTIVGKLVVDVAGTYRFKLEDMRGGVELDPAAHKVTLYADAPPSVALDEPKSDRTVKIDDEVDVAFAARDDVGLTKMRVVVKRQGSARDAYVKDLLDVPGALREARGTGAFYVAATGARPGDRLSVYIEALDNDSVSGPNVGRSPTRVLTVYSAAQQHRTVIQRLEEVMARMVDSLADELEAPVTSLVRLPEVLRALERHETISARHTPMQQALGDALLALAEDEMSPPPTRRALANMKLKVQRAIENRASALKSLTLLVARKAALPRSVTTRFTDAQAQLVDRLEHDILYLEDLLNRERIAEAHHIAEDLQRAQLDLKALIDQFKKTGDSLVQQALLDEMQRMRKQMGELMERLAKLQHDIPDEHLNVEAFDGDEMLEQANDIDQLIEEGKLDEAAAQLDKMLESTKRLVDDLDKSGEEYGGDEYRELRQKMQRFAHELEALQQGQNEALDQSQALMDKARAHTEQRLQGKLDKALADVKKKVERAKAELLKLDKDALMLNESEDAAFAEARMEDLQRALESRDLDDATGAVQEAEAAARSAEHSVSDRTRGPLGQKDRATLAQQAALAQTRSELESARKQLQELVPDADSRMDKDDQHKLHKAADRQQQLEENAERLERMMDEMAQEAPVFGPEHKKRLEDARQQMQRASKELHAHKLHSARSAQRQALRQLIELGRDLEQRGKGAGAGGMPLPLPRGGDPGADDEGDGRGVSNENVKIPDGSEFKVPDAFRKDILDAMREGVPKSWAGDVKRYYEKLIK